MKINILRAFWNFEVNELSTASGVREQILRPPRAAKTVATPLRAGGRAESEPYYSQRARRVCVSLSAFYGRTLSDASMLYFADVYIYFLYGRLSWSNG